MQPLEIRDVRFEKHEPAVQYQNSSTVPGASKDGDGREDRTEPKRKRRRGRRRRRW